VALYPGNRITHEVYADGDKSGLRGIDRVQIFRNAVIPNYIFLKLIRLNL
jgi:hypothetical protein